MSQSLLLINLTSNSGLTQFFIIVLEKKMSIIIYINESVFWFDYLLSCIIVMIRTFNIPNII